MSLPAQNRAQLLTPAGPAAIAVVRILGPGVAALLGGCFSRPVSLGRAIHGELRDGERLIDDPVIVLLEDGVGADINLHGGPWVVRSCLDLLRRHGFEIDESTDDPADLDLADGKTTLHREIFAHLPAARTERSLRTLLGQHAAWERFKASSPTPQQIRDVMADCSLHWLLNPPTAAIVGQPNVGKSTLANLLFGQERSITADLPGTTRDWVGEIANIGGLAMMLLDTPGLRKTTDEIEHAAIAKSRQRIEGADLILLVLDASAPIESQRAVTKEFPLTTEFTEGKRTAAAGATILHVANKCDKPLAWNPQEFGALCLSAASGAGLDALQQAMRGPFVRGANLKPTFHPWTARQLEILSRANQTPGVLDEM